MNIVEAAFNVSLDNPGASWEALGRISECCYAASLRAKPVGAVAELLLIDRFKGHL